MKSLANILFFSFVTNLKLRQKRTRPKLSAPGGIFGFMAVSVVWLILGGCNPTKNLTEGQYLLNKNSIKSNRSELNDDLSTLTKQKPNRRILGIFRFHLGVYNLVNQSENKIPKNRYQRFTKKTREWIKETIGEEPVILDSLATLKSVKQMELYLHNKGYFNAVVKDSTRLKNKKAKVSYHIETAQAYTIRNISRESKDSLIHAILTGEQHLSLLKSGDNYDVGVLQKERDRFTNDLKNRGYYFFNKEYVYFKIDSSLKSHQVDIVMGVRIQNENSKSLKEEMHHVYKINNVYIQPDYNPRTLENIPTDTLVHKNYYFVSYSKELQYKPDILLQKIFIKKDSVFKSLHLENSYRGLSDLGVFKFTNIRFEEVKDSGSYKLNCIIHLTPAAKESFSLETEGTHNGGILGVAGNITFRNKNTFKGAELFEFKLRGAMEATKSYSENNDRIFNTLRVGPELSLNFQKFLLPFKFKNQSKFLNSQTTIPVSYNYERRPDYNRSSTNISLNYNWRQSTVVSHSITPIEISKVNVEKDAIFEKKLQDLNDPLISNSYRTHLTTVTRYTLFINNQDINKKTDFSFFRFSTEFSGNILRTANNILNSPISNNSYKVLGVNYSQYIRPEFDYRYYYVLNPYNTLVYRTYFGVGWAYKNSTSLPVEKLFFAGGANDIRGWQARTLGPGSYRAPVNSIDQNGDFKLEANLEYRFYVFKILEGAAFIDAGNVWALNDSSRQGSQLGSNFLSEIAIAGGLGARLNFTFFIFRLDAGIKIKDPSKDPDHRYIYQNTKIKDINWNLGIGYPF